MIVDTENYKKVVKANNDLIHLYGEMAEDVNDYNKGWGKMALEATIKIMEFGTADPESIAIFVKHGLLPLDRINTNADSRE